MRLNKLAIIGLGVLVKKHLSYAKKIKPHLNISTVNKQMKMKGDGLVDQNFLSVEDLISFGIQAAIISNPAPFHLDYAIKFINAGVHVLIEKPFQIIYKKLKNINDQGKTNAKVLLGYCFRHDKNAIFLKE